MCSIAERVQTIWAMVLVNFGMWIAHDGKKVRCMQRNQRISMEKKVKKNDIILIVVILVLALGSYIGIRYYQSVNTNAPTAVVTVKDVEYGRFPLDKNVTEKIELPDGAYNILVIQDGKADITEASCPDGICVNHRPISMVNETIVCLPNELVVEIENGEESDVDSMTN